MSDDKPEYPDATWKWQRISPWEKNAVVIQLINGLGEAVMYLYQVLNIYNERLSEAELTIQEMKKRLDDTTPVS